MAPEPFSIERRLVRRLGAILLGAFLLFGVFYAVYVRADAEGHAAEDSRDIAQNLARAIPPGATVLPPNPTLAARRIAFAAWDMAAARALTGSDPAIAARLARLPADTSAVSEITGVPGAETMFAAVRDAAGPRTLLVGITAPVSANRVALTGLIDEYVEEILPTFGPAMLVAFLVAWATIRRALAPLRRASAEAEEVSADRPGKRVSLDGVGAELIPLIEAVNHAVSRLEQALAVQRRFTANAAHEMRTPIAVIRARIDALPESPQRAALARDADRLARLVAQMLARARLQSGETGPREPVDLGKLAQSTLAELAPMAHAQSRDLVLEENAPATVRANPLLLESLLRNLVENALRFTPPDGVVTVQAGPGARLRVIDQGPGILPEHIDHVFEPFWRAPGQSGGGAGLGLAIARDIAAMHGGRLTAETAGTGAAFTLDLPSAPDLVPA